MANSKQAKKRARQSEIRRVRNMHYKTSMRTRIKQTRYALDAFKVLEGGKSLHQQDVEKHLRNLCEVRAHDYKKIGRSDVLDKATSLLSKFDQAEHKGFLVELAGANFAMAEKAIRHAASKGAIHKRTADRKISRLALALSAMVKAYEGKLQEQAA